MSILAPREPRAGRARSGTLANARPLRPRPAACPMRLHRGETMSARPRVDGRRGDGGRREGPASRTSSGKRGCTASGRQLFKYVSGAGPARLWGPRMTGVETFVFSNSLLVNLCLEQIGFSSESEALCEAWLRCMHGWIWSKSCSSHNYPRQAGVTQLCGHRERPVQIGATVRVDALEGAGGKPLRRRGRV